MEDVFDQSRSWRHTRCTNRLPHIDAETRFVRKNIRFCDFRDVLCNFQPEIARTKPFDCCHGWLTLAANRNGTKAARTTKENIDAAIPLQTASPDHQTQWHGAISHLIDIPQIQLYNRGRVGGHVPTLSATPCPSHQEGSTSTRRRALCG